MFERLRTLPVALLIACSGGPEPEPEPEPDPDPIIARVDITPQEPCTTDGLLASGRGGEITRYQWYRNGEPTSNNTDFVPPESTRKGEVWRVEIEVDGAEEPGVDEVEIVNCGPLISTVTIQPDPAFANSTILTEVDAFDPDDDRLTFTYSWFVDGERLEDVAGSRLLPGNFARGQDIYVEVVANDGELDSTPRRSNTIGVINSPPTAPRVSVDPGAPNDIENLQCIIVSQSTDADGDPISYRFEWYVDGVRSTSVLTTVYLGDTTPARATRPGQSWECVVIANDGLEDSAAGRISVDIERATTLPGTALGDLVRVAPNTFTMGCVDRRDDIDEDDNCEDDERFVDELPDHRVQITRDLWVMPTEVTQARWTAGIVTTPSFHADCGDDCPVESVNWYEALRFANLMSDSDGLDPCYTLTECSGTLGGGCGGAESCEGETYTCAEVGVTATGGDPTLCAGYRLPTEAEWEFLGRGTMSGAYPGVRDLEEMAWFEENSEGVTHPVCEKDTNVNRLCDMAGNVREWTWDWYADDTYPDTSRADPLGPDEGELRVCRGGHFGSDEAGVRLAKRDAATPTLRSRDLGFRLVRSIVP